MEINGQNFENIPYSNAVDILRNNTHLAITVKTNIFGEFGGLSDLRLDHKPVF